MDYPDRSTRTEGNAGYRLFYRRTRRQRKNATADLVRGWVTQTVEVVSCSPTGSQSLTRSAPSSEQLRPFPSPDLSDEVHLPVRLLKLRV